MKGVDVVEMERMYGTPRSVGIYLNPYQSVYLFYPYYNLALTLAVTSLASRLYFTLSTLLIKSRNVEFGELRGVSPHTWTPTDSFSRL